VEDLEYHLLLVNAGKRVRFADRATVYGVMPDDADAQSSQRARWEGGRLRVTRDWVPKLAAQFRRRRFSAVEPLFELLTLPLAYLATVSLFLCALPYGFFRWYGAAVLALLLTHVVSAISLGDEFWKDLMSLLAAPFYVAWKVTTLPAVFRSSNRKTEWLRTQRKSGAI
jgi:cellulose synthase/poly-beta-1,6-N-acetylglucosamine synthase-like glycosyltransferase